MEKQLSKANFVHSYKIWYEFNWSGVKFSGLNMNLNCAFNIGVVS